MKIYFLGGGNMAAAIAGGLKKHGGYSVCIAERGAERRAWLAENLGTQVCETLPEIGADDVLVLAVKPQDMQAACAGIKVRGALVLSVAAGLGIGILSSYLGGTQRIVRVMPNMPAKIGLGVSGMFAAEQIPEQDKIISDGIMQTVGTTVWLDSEDKLHALTGISGSGPGYVFYLMNALQQAARRQGFDDETARILTLDTFKGAVLLAEQSGMAFELLQQQVTSKGGTTHAALETFRRHQVADNIQSGVEACIERSREIAGGM